MHTYAATYITGLGDLIETALSHEVSDFELVGHDDGLLVFKTERTYEELLHISYINNIFDVLSYEPPSDTNRSVHAVVKNLAKACSFSKISGKTFRLMVMHGSKLEHVTKEIATVMKEKISRGTELQFSPLKADVEFWVLIRNNGAVMFGYKKETVLEKIPLQKGELRPKIAELLVMASKPQAEDVFLDPFAGCGSIPAARIRLDTFQTIIGVEKKGQLVEELKRRFKKEKNVSIHQGDALKMNFIEDGSITTIVTDPPWGIFEELNVDIAQFYTNMLEEFTRILKNDGKAVILTGQPEALHVSLEGISSLQLQKTYTTLVNGKKATVFLLQKVGESQVSA